jgi:hypothetical protein
MSMSDFDALTTKNALLYAMRVYDNPQCLTEHEFFEDYKRFKYVKRLCSRYVVTRRLSERLLLNHLMLLRNVFGDEAMVRLLFLKCDDPHVYQVLKAFLLYMECLPTVVLGINGADIYTETIPVDEHVQRTLEALDT